MAEGNQPAAGVVSPDQARPGLWQDADRPALPDHRLLFHIEPDPLHVRQYDFGRKQQAAHVISRRQRLHLHCGFDEQRTVGGAHEPAEVASNAKLLAEVARNRAQIGPAAAPDLNASHRFGTGVEAQHPRLVDLDLACVRPGLLAPSRELVSALAVDLDRRESGWLLEDPARECFEGSFDITGRQRAWVADGFALGLGVVGRCRKAQVDVGDICLRESKGELGESCC